MQDANISEELLNWKMPCLVQGKIKQESIRDHKSKYTVLAFFSSDFHKVNSYEINMSALTCAYIDRHNTKVIFISSDSIESHKKWTTTDHLDEGIHSSIWPIFSDESKTLLKLLKLTDPEDESMNLSLIFDENMKIRYVSSIDCRVCRTFNETMRIIETITKFDSGCFTPLT